MHAARALYAFYTKSNSATFFYMIDYLSQVRCGA